MSDSIRKAIEFNEERLGINPIDDKAFSKAFTNYRNFVNYCYKKYQSDRPPEDSEDFHEYLTLKKKLATFYVHCKNERFKKTLLEHHPEFADL